MEWSGTFRQEKRIIFFVPYLTRPHEMGHALGLAHFDGTAPSVMYSYYNNCASSPQQVDIDGLNSLYS